MVSICAVVKRILTILTELKAKAVELQEVGFCRSVVEDPDMGPMPELVNVGLFEYRPCMLYLNAFECVFRL
jgi:hypothetical protein